MRSHSRRNSQKQGVPASLSIPRSRPPRKTLTGETALQAISRFSTDVAKGVASRYSSQQGVSNLAKDVTKLMSLINTEDKHVDTLSTALPVSSSTFASINIPGPAAGTAVNQRIGDSILINQIDMELLFNYGGTAATATFGTQTFRYWLLRYLKTPASGGASSFSLTEFINPDVNGVYTPLSLMNTDTNENFQVMVTGDVSIDLATLASASISYTKTIPVRHSCHFHQEYNGSLASNVCDNALFFVAVAQNSTNTGSVSTITPSFRIFYVDN
jgi:hypothetical protein